MDYAFLELRDAFLIHHPGWAFGLVNNSLASFLCPLEAGSPPLFVEDGPRYTAWVNYIEKATQDLKDDVQNMPLIIPGLTSMECWKYKMLSQVPFTMPPLPPVEKWARLYRAVTIYTYLGCDARVSEPAREQRKKYRAAIWCDKTVESLIRLELTREEAQAVLTYMYELYSIYPPNTLLAHQVFNRYAIKKGIQTNDAREVMLGYM
jgi:hypothetical protein